VVNAVVALSTTSLLPLLGRGYLRVLRKPISSSTSPYCLQPQIRLFTSSRVSFTMANSSDQTSLSLEDIESQLSSLALLKSQKLAELEAKKSKKDKKKAKSGKLDVKVPKGTKGTTHASLSN